MINKQNIFGRCPRVNILQSCSVVKYCLAVVYYTRKKKNNIGATKNKCTNYKRIIVYLNLNCSFGSINQTVCI